MLNTEKEIILKDQMLINLETEVTMKDNSIFQCEMPETKITKYVYKLHNEVFCKKEHSMSPTRKCIFTLHTNLKSSYVQIYDNKGDVVFSGNSLWSNKSSSTKEEHLEFIKLCHSVDDVIKKYK